jgi:hypothetical protein
MLARSLILAALVPVTAFAQSSQQVPLTNNVYDVFQLTSASPTTSFPIQVSGANQLIVDVRTDATAPVLRLVAPDGSAVDPATFTQSTLADADVPPLGTIVTEAGTHVQASIPTPLSGTWTAELSLPAGAPDTDGTLAALMTGGVAVGAVTSSTSYQQGDVAVLGLLAFDGPAPLQGASVTANVYQVGAEDSPLAIVLRDDGNDPDAAAGDGLYSAPVDLGSFAPGQYLVEMVLEAGAARMTTATEFEVMPPLAHFSGTVGDEGIDANGDGLFDQIAIDLGVSVDMPGSYAVSVVLRRDATHSVRAATVKTLAAGDAVVKVPFAAEDIRASLAGDGPYQIAEANLVRLPDSSLGERPADGQTDLGSTSAWLLSQLQRPLVIIPAALADTASDADGNGLFDSLRVGFTIDTRQADFFTWSGELRAADGSVLGIASGAAFLSAGINQVSFTFDGRRIGASNLDGPYTVANVAAYGSGDDSALLDVLGKTTAYTATQFEGSRAQVSFARLIDEVNRLVITGKGGIPKAQVIRTSLLQKTHNAQDASLAGKITVSRNLLGAFASEVNAQSGIHLSPVDATALVDLAQRLEATL